jgi:hypothetical protein
MFITKYFHIAVLGAVGARGVAEVLMTEFHNFANNRKSNSQLCSVPDIELELYRLQDNTPHYQ